MSIRLQILSIESAFCTCSQLKQVAIVMIACKTTKLSSFFTDQLNVDVTLDTTDQLLTINSPPNHCTHSPVASLALHQLPVNMITVRGLIQTICGNNNVIVALGFNPFPPLHNIIVSQHQSITISCFLLVHIMYLISLQVHAKAAQTTHNDSVVACTRSRSLPS